MAAALTNNIKRAITETQRQAAYCANYERVLKLISCLQHPTIHFIDYRSSSKKLLCITGTVQRAYETPEVGKVDLKPFWLYKYEKTDYSYFGSNNPETLISTYGEAISLTYPGLVIEGRKNNREYVDRVMSLESDFDAHKKEATEIILEITGKTTAQELNKYFQRAKSMSQF